MVYVVHLGIKGYALKITGDDGSPYTFWNTAV